MWTGLVSVRLCASGGGYHKRRGISWLAEWLLASQETLCSRALDGHTLATVSLSLGSFSKSASTCLQRSPSSQTRYPSNQNMKLHRLVLCCAE
jgi:hypothetical protein